MPIVTPKVQAVIMAGGRGERLQPLTVARPKPAVPFGGIFRLIDFTLSNCLNSGLSRVALLTQYRHEQLQTYIQQGWSGFWTKRTQEPLMCHPPNAGRQYRGTADAVLQNVTALQQRGSESVLILSADHVYRMDYREFLRYHAETNADLTIATVEHPLTAAKDFGVVEVDSEHKVVGFQEKPLNPRPVPSRPAAARINMGVYAFKTEVLMQALNRSCNEDKRYDFGRDVIPSLIGSAHVRAYDFRDEMTDLPCYWRDIGTIDSYYETSMDLVQPEPPFDPFANEDWPYPIRNQNPQQIRARLRTNCHVTRSILSPGVHIEAGGWIESSVLMPGVRIGKGARIRHAIIDENVHVPAGCQIGFDLQDDRKHHFVTSAGVVVVSQMPKRRRLTAACESTYLQILPVQAGTYKIPAIARVRKAAIVNKHQGIDPFVSILLEKITAGKQELSFQKGETIFCQGDPADSIYFIQTGRVKITVVSSAGKEAVLAMPGPHEFFGEGALANRQLRISMVRALEPVTAFRIEKRAMIRALHEQPEFAEKFMAALLARHIDLEEDLCDQLFNPSEKRLARVLLKLSRLRANDDEPYATIPRLNHETLAEIVGTTRSRITYFMNKFRAMGLVDYDRELTVRTELLTDLVLHD